LNLHSLYENGMILYSPGGERHQCYRCFINLSPRARVRVQKGEHLKYRPEYDMKVIGENLRRLRKKKALSVRYVKDYLRFDSVQAVYRYEEGTCYPQTDTMFALMELYEATLEDIIYKYEDSVCNYNEEGREPSSVVCRDYIIDGFEIEVIDYKVATKQRINRCKRYMELFEEALKRGIAN